MEKASIFNKQRRKEYKDMKRFLPVITAVGCVFVLSGCIGAGTPAPMTEQYIIEYSPPVYDDTLPRIDEPIRVERFSVSRHLNCRSMFYKPAPFKREAYNYHCWRINPGDMITDCLLRDLRASGLFKAVFSSYDYGTTRFRLEGCVDECMGVYEQTPGKARLGLTVTLLDTKAENATKTILFQKNYKTSELLENRTPEELTRSMSRAMCTLSQQITKDIYTSLESD